MNTQNPTASDPSTVKLIMLGAVLSLPLTAVALLSFKNAVLVLAGLSGIAALVFVSAISARFVPILLFVGLIGTVSVPIDKYFAYQEHVGGWPGIRISAADLFLLLLIPLALLGWLRGTIRNRIPTVILVFYALILVQYGVSSLGAPERGLAVFEIASASHAIVLALTCAAFFKREYVVPIMLLLAVQIILHTVFAGLQVATGRPIGVGLGAGATSVVMESFETGGARLRPSGLFDHPIVFANFLMMGFPLMAAGALMTASKWIRLILISACLIAALGLGLTLSRGAWISTATAVSLFVVMSWRQGLLSWLQFRRLVVIGLVGVVLLGALLGPRIVERMTASQAGNLEVRFELNAIALRMIAANPLTGVGLNNFIPTMEHYDPDDVMEYFPATVHNLYLLEASEAGIPALLFCVGLMTALWITAWRRIGAVEDAALKWFAIAILASLGGFALSQLADFSHRLEPLRSIVWVNIGLLFGALYRARTAARIAVEEERNGR